ncbi:MAG TPA: sulfite exporter TauE/SafE family protein [Proteobacteria bacterium]|mgnify:CR=1 FL=1|nr:sulfite exporter TauE/SafE family protein [Pseudomonadota bacterium]
MLQYLLLFAVGLIAGALNVIAGGGSFLTIPLLIFMGLPPVIANGTNRVGILCQNIAASWRFHQHGVVEWRHVRWAAVPAVIGALLGSKLAVAIGDELFKNVLAGLMITVTLWTIWDPLKNKHQERRPESFNRAALAGGFFLVGIYGGFVQAGVGFLILAATTMAGLDLVKGNAVKVLSILAYTFISLGIFAWEGKVVWSLGLILAAGTIVGSQIGVHLTILKGHHWIKRVVTAVIIMMAVKLIIS